MSIFGRHEFRTAWAGVCESPYLMTAITYISFMWGGNLSTVLACLCLVLALAVAVLSSMYVFLRKRYSDETSSLRQEIESLMSRKYVASPKYFSVCFKKTFGMTPSEYRAEYASNGTGQAN